MSGIQVMMPLQMICRLMIAKQLGENVTLPVILEPASAEMTDSPALPSGYIAFPEIGFAYKLSNTTLTHDDAREICLGDNGQLAVIDSWDKVDKIFDHFNFTKTIWVGLNKVYNTGRWTTIDGKSTEDLPWARAEPTSGMRCGSLSRLRNGLRNFDCGNSYSYLCEIKLPRN